MTRLPILSLPENGFPEIGSTFFPFFNEDTDIIPARVHTPVQPVLPPIEKNELFGVIHSRRAGA